MSVTPHFWLYLKLKECQSLTECVCGVCVIGLQSWMHWCLAISSLYWLLDSPALSWQRGSRATAIFCPSADALNRPTLKTRAPEGLKITYHLFSYILSFSHSPDCSPKKLKCLKQKKMHTCPFSCFSFTCGFLFIHHLQKFKNYECPKVSIICKCIKNM